MPIKGLTARVGGRKNKKRKNNRNGKKEGLPVSSPLLVLLRKVGGDHDVGSEEGDFDPNDSVGLVYRSDSRNRNW